MDLHCFEETVLERICFSRMLSYHLSWIQWHCLCVFQRLSLLNILLCISKHSLRILTSCHNLFSILELKLKSYIINPSQTSQAILLNPMIHAVSSKMSTGKYLGRDTKTLKFNTFKVDFLHLVPSIVSNYYAVIFFLSFTRQIAGTLWRT